MEELHGWYIATNGARLITDDEQISILYDGRIVGSVEFTPGGYVVNSSSCLVVVNPDTKTINIVPRGVQH